MIRRSSPLMANFETENGINKYKSDTKHLAFMVLEMSQSKNFVKLVSNSKRLEEEESMDVDWVLDSNI